MDDLVGSWSVKDEIIFILGKYDGPKVYIGVLFENDHMIIYFLDGEAVVRYPEVQTVDFGQINSALYYVEWGLKQFPEYKRSLKLIDGDFDLPHQVIRQNLK